MCLTTGSYVPVHHEGGAMHIYAGLSRPWPRAGAPAPLEFIYIYMHLPAWIGPEPCPPGPHLCMLTRMGLINLYL